MEEITEKKAITELLPFEDSKESLACFVSDKSLILILKTKFPEICLQK